MLSDKKKRVLDSLNHKQPDRIPFDLGGTPITGIHVSCIPGIREYLGLEPKVSKVIEPFTMLGELDDDIIEILEIDTQPVWSRKCLFGVENKDYKEWVTPYGQTVLIPGGFSLTGDNKGGYYCYPQGNTNLEPSGYIPSGGYYFDILVRQNHFDENNLNPADNLEEYGPADELDISFYKEKINSFDDSAGAVIVSLGGTALGDIAAVPAAWLDDPRGIRDMEEWYISVITRQEYIHAVFDAQTNIALENLERYNREFGSKVDIAVICGADFGTQNSLFCSLDTFRTLYFPYYKRINDWIHANTRWKTFKHCCGAIFDLIPLFIECGFDIINPVQCSCPGMDPRRLKEAYGQEITFWGGAVDVQHTLPFGSPSEVEKEVLERCEIFSKDGGFVFNAIHNIQHGTPTENTMAMINALRRFNGQTLL